MNNIIDIVSEKKTLDNNNKLFYTINKKILWITYVKPILKLYKEKELSYEKIEELIYFLQIIKFKYNTLGYIIKYSVDQYFRTVNIEDSDYKLQIIIYNVDKSVEIEYIVNYSNTRYVYSIPDKNSNKFRGCVYERLHDNINLILNNAMYELVKDYILKG